MDLDFSASGTIDPVAGYAAVVATIVALLEIVRWWRSGAQPRVTATPDMIFVPAPSGMTAGASFIFVKVRNVGDTPTTLATLGIYQYLSRWNRWRRKVNKAGVVPDPARHTGAQLPFVLRPGEQWTGAIEQDALIMGLASTGLLYVSVGHSMAKRELQVRVMIPVSEAASETDGR